jgi:hypothetical protein
MSYTVTAQAGDCLCSIAIRHGFSNCGTLRSDPANANLLDGPLPPNAQVSIPQPTRASWFYSSLATGRRWTVRWAQPVAVPQPVEVRIVRTSNLAPSNNDTLQSLGISRYITAAGNLDGSQAWVDDTRRVFDQNSFNDINCFNVEVVDPNVATGDVDVYLEALMPLYGVGGALQGHQRFPGPERARRSLTVKLSPQPNPNQGRRRSCYLRLVVDDVDKQARPKQTLLVTDMVDAGHPEVEILDQNIRATYEYSGCPRPVGQRCVLGWHEIPLRRGRSVGVHARILRDQRTGVVGTVANNQGDDGVVTRDDVSRRFLINNRRIYAQEELAFVIHSLETVDRPSQMLAVGDPDGQNASGQNGAGNGTGVVGFTLNVQPFNGNLQAFVVNAGQVQANSTPDQTAQLIEQAALQAVGQNVQGFAVARSQNPAVDGANAGSVDLLFSAPNAFVSIANLTQAAAQDAQQTVAAVEVDLDPFIIGASITNAHVGSPMQRNLYKSFTAQPTRLNLYVVTRLGGANAIAHTLNSGRRLGLAFQSLPAMENCFCFSVPTMDGQIDTKPANLSHEIGHALMDNAEHALSDNCEGDIMKAATSESFVNSLYNTKRIHAAQDAWLFIVDQQPYDIPPGQNQSLGIRQEMTDMHTAIGQNNRIQFQNR